MSASNNEGVWTPPEAPDGVDEQKAKKLLREIVALEYQNEKKAAKSSDAQMIQNIANKIRSAV